MFANLLLLTFVISTHAAETCAIKPDNKGYRALVESVYKTNVSKRQLQKLAGLPETPVTKPPSSVDVVKWCRCRHQRRIEMFGQERAHSMEAMDQLENYYRWLKTLTPKQIQMHLAIDESIAAGCYNSSASIF